MLDISIDEAKAKMWIDDVNHELDAVESVLKKVNASLSTVAGSDDSIMEGIYKVGTAMESTWTKMCNNFKSAQNKLSDAIAELVKSANSVIDDAEALSNKIGQ